MAEIEDLKAQLAVLRSQLRDIEANDKIDLNEKMNLALRISKAIRKIYAINQQDTALRIIEAIKNKSQTPIKHESLNDPLDAQYPLKTQTTILRQLLFSPEWETTDGLKRSPKLPNEIKRVYGLNRKEIEKQWNVAEANYSLGFKFQTPRTMTTMIQLDDELIDSPISLFDDPIK